MKEETKIRTLTAMLEDCAYQLSIIYAKRQDAYTLECLNNVNKAIDEFSYEIVSDLAGYSQSSKTIRAYNKMITGILK